MSIGLQAFNVLSASLTSRGDVARRRAMLQAAGVVVTRDGPPGITVVGTPAKSLVPRGI